jgi:hypothetical protein
MADVEIQRRTNNRFRLHDALRGANGTGGSMDYDWPLARALKAPDDAIGVPVLAELDDQMKATPVTPDLPALWHELGVSTFRQFGRARSTAPTPWSCVPSWRGDRSRTRHTNTEMARNFSAAR